MRYNYTRFNPRDDYSMIDITAKQEYDSIQIIIDKKLTEYFSMKDGRNHYSKDGVINPSLYFKYGRARICFYLKKTIVLILLLELYYGILLMMA